MKDKLQGCEICPRNGVKGIHKIFGTVEGKPIMLWAQSPGVDENAYKDPDTGQRGKELIGKAGNWLWKELARVGISRDDCDIQNVVRCLPADLSETGYWELRDPTKDEIKACTYYTKQAIEKQRAKVWLVFGRPAKEVLFGKNRTAGDVFELDGHWNFILDHPSYFLRGAPRERLERFRTMLDMVREKLAGRKAHKFAMYQDINVTVADTRLKAVEAAKTVLRLAGGQNRVAYDEEDDVIDGERKLLMVGACPKPGQVFVFVLHHPGNPAPPEERYGVESVVKKLLTHPHEKILQHGNHDDDTFEDLLGVRLEGYHFDTQYASFFSDPTQRSHSLTNIVARNHPRYTNYKDLVIEAVPEGMTVEDGRDVGDFHLAKVPLKKVIYYNGMDCHVTKLEEQRVKDRIPIPLVRIYLEAAYVLGGMEKFGPLLDYEHYNQLLEIYPKKKEFFRDRLCTIAENPELNTNSPKQLNELIYGKWGIDPVSDPPDTQRETLEYILQKTKHKGLIALQDYREAKNRLERIESFKRSADAHDGRVATIWWLTGARTGRLSSGGGTRPDKKNLGNLQNIASDDIIKNQLVSSKNWRLFYKAASHDVDRATKLFKDMDWFVAADYGQQEVRTIAVAAGETKLIEMFQSGKDIHSAIGSLWSGWSVEELLEEGPKRTLVKIFHFSVIYGKTAPGLHRDLEAQGVKVSLGEVAQHIKNYFREFRHVEQYIKDCISFVENNGFIENLFGFRVPIDIHKSKGGFWKNQAVNSPIQGAAHQVLLCALALMKRHPERYSIIRPQMEIHDALVNVTPFEQIVEMIGVIRKLMEEDVMEVIKQELKVNWTVPLKADVKIGLRFGGMVKYRGDLKAVLTSPRDSEGKATNVLDKVHDQDMEIAKVQKQYAHVVVQ